MISDNIVIAAHFSPARNAWSGFAVEMGKNGTHKEYHVIYNGVCTGEYFATEGRAKEEADKAVKDTYK